MTMEPGTQLGHYTIASLIGAGGMGEVYRATDTKLKRDVAVKVLPSEVASDPERLARFQREAEVLASLNHPNIAAIYGLEDAGDTKALVMELVEGPTLADRIAQGPIPVDEALPIAKQIAEALEAAHEQGIIHRDLKPANVKVRPDGTVKVLDFGLAKAMEPPGVSPSVSQSPTISMAATQAGIILGTAAYMSPEQSRGKAVDKRADIWAFGVVLYEMLTGQQAFADEDVSMTLSKVLRVDPDFDALPDDVSARVRQALKVCLQKDAKQRGGDMAAIRLALEGAFETVAPEVAEVVQAVPQSKVPLVAAIVITAIVASLAVWVTRPAPPVPLTVTRFPLVVPDTDTVNSDGGMALSPTGDRIVYSAIRDGTRQLFLRTRDQAEAVAISGTGNAVHPFFSPDGEWVGFFTGTELRRVSLSGGPTSLITTAGDRRGASWGEDDTIVFSATDAPNLRRVLASGGEPTALTTPADGTTHRWPEWLPSGEAVLFTINAGRWISQLPERSAVLGYGGDPGPGKWNGRPLRTHGPPRLWPGSLAVGRTV